MARLTDEAFDRLYGWMALGPSRDYKLRLVTGEADTEQFSPPTEPVSYATRPLVRLRATRDDLAAAR